MISGMFSSEQNSYFLLFNSSDLQKRFHRLEKQYSRDDLQEVRYSTSESGLECGGVTSQVQCKQSRQWYNSSQ